MSETLVGQPVDEQELYLGGVCVYACVCRNEQQKERRLSCQWCGNPQGKKSDQTGPTLVSTTTSIHKHFQKKGMKEKQKNKKRSCCYKQTHLSEIPLDVLVRLSGRVLGLRFEPTVNF